MRTLPSLRTWLVLGLALTPATAFAQAAPPAGHDDTAFDVMNLLTEHGLHDIENESWNAYGQFTYISSWKQPFSAPYTNLNGSPNSLSPKRERSFTGTFTLFLGVHLWPGGEAYFVPEVVALRPLSDLRGLGGAIQNFELQRGGTETPQLYRSRTYLRQTFGFGGAPVEKPSDPTQLATTVDSRRLVLTAGNLSILDLFDRNGVTWDPRQTFLNLAFMTHAAWDFAADARGYSYGAAAELYFDDWTARFGRFATPKYPNQLQMDFRVHEFYGDQLEIEHRHRLAGLDGAVRVLGYRNRVNGGRFTDAVAAFQADRGKNATTCPGFSYGSGNSGAPDLCWVRQPNVKYGIGVSLEQFVAKDIGVFFRGMISDGGTEVYGYTSTDRSVSLGAVAKGTLWHRDLDVTGIGVGVGWISDAHAEYLRLGGIDGFVGDGTISPGAETVFEVFYSVNFLRAVWLTADFQHLVHPAFNRDRGHVEVLGGRIHAEF